MVGRTTDVLYTLNTTTGRAIQVGSAVAGFGVSEERPSGLAAIGNTLYMVGTRYMMRRNEAVLYTLNTATGGATRVGLANQFGVGEITPTGLAAIGDTLYIIGAGADALYALRYQ